MHFTRFMRCAAVCGALFAATFLVGCAGPSPNYAPSIDNVEALKKTGAAQVTVGTMTPTPTLATAKAIQLRAASMVSSVGSNYGDYISAALRQELEMARLFDPKSPIEISGTLTRNDIEAGGLSTNQGFIEARFIVRSGPTVRYDKVKSVTHQWESSFAGAVAIPLAASNYPILVQKLIGSLVQDPDFVQAIKN